MFRSHPISYITLDYHLSSLLALVQPQHLLLRTVLTLLADPAHLQARREMECVDAALKTSFRKEMAIKTTSQAILEDVCVLNAQYGAPCDDFSVDDLLDFSNQEAILEEQVHQEEEENKVVSISVPVSSQKETQWRGLLFPSSIFNAKDDVGSLLHNELQVPVDELADLEWLSHFVDDSFAEHSTYSSGTFTEERPQHALAADKIPEPRNTVQVKNKTRFNSPVPAKARSKRTRTTLRGWSLGSPPLTESSSSSTSSSSSSFPPASWLMYASTATQNSEPVFTNEATKPLGKKPKKNAVGNWSGLSSVAGGGQAPRRCSHCGVQKTPQWRAGPLGAKTLCNACGVRHKSGRLLPEYRPACSPTFSRELHSNHHRKVLEMRRKKELTSGIDSGISTPAVPSF